MPNDEHIRIDPEAADEFADKWANEAVKSPGAINREAWLWAYERYDFSAASDPKNLAQIADMFREWNKNKKGRR